MAKHIPENIEKTTENDKGEFHSFDDQPAIVSKLGTKMWFHHGKLHRLYGPAVALPSGIKEFWVAGSNVTNVVEGYAKEWDVDLNNMEESDYSFMWLKLGLGYTSDNKPVFDAKAR